MPASGFASHLFTCQNLQRDKPAEGVGLGGLEPPTSRLSGVRSNHLSYRPRGTTRPGWCVNRTAATAVIQGAAVEAVRQGQPRFPENQVDEHQTVRSSRETQRD